jgi:hypothetical protein
MALTISGVVRDVIGSKRCNRGIITFDSSYAAGGEDLTPAVLGLSVIDHIAFVPVPLQVSSNHVALTHTYDYTNKKILAYEQGMRTGSTTAGAMSNGAYAEDVAAAETVIRLSGTAVDTNYGFGGLREVAATKDLSSYACRFEAIGR